MQNPQPIFSDLSFCWELFENDGLTDYLIEEYLKEITDPVIVLGSGQGIVSHRLIREGMEVTSVDSVPEMAKRAEDRRGVKTIPSDILDLSFNSTYNTVILNTGVISPGSMRAIDQFAGTVLDLLDPGGTAIITCFARTDFDDLVRSLCLDTSPEVPLQIWRFLQCGSDIFSALHSTNTGHSLTPYHQKRFYSELREYEAQIRNAGKAFQNAYPEKDVEAFLAKSLRYVPFGLPVKDQNRVISSFEDVGLVLQSFNKHDHVLVSILRKEV